jgi:hypothetical protein
VTKEQDMNENRQKSNMKRRIPTTLLIFGIIDMTLPFHSHLDLPGGNLEQI